MRLGTRAAAATSCGKDLIQIAALFPVRNVGGYTRKLVEIGVKLFVFGNVGKIFQRSSAVRADERKFCERR